MRKLYTVTYQRTVVAHDQAHAEELARMVLTIEDPDVDATAVASVLPSTDNIVERCEKFVRDLYKIEGMGWQVAEASLEAFVKANGYTLNKEEVQALYRHCERVIEEEE